jgi:hypothetical protein
MAKFEEFTFHELRRCRSELHTTQGRKGKVMIFEPSQASRHTPDHAAKESPVPLPIPPQISTAPESRPKRLCSRGAGSRRPKGPNRGDNGSNWLLYTSRSGGPGFFFYQTGAP